MDLELIEEYIDPQLIILVPMLWGVGMAVKKSSIKNNFIPFILLLFSCGVVMLHLMSTKPVWDMRCISACLFAGITQGSVIWLCAWWGYEKVLKNREV